MFPQFYILLASILLLNSFPNILYSFQHIAKILEHLNSGTMIIVNEFPEAYKVILSLQNSQGCFNWALLPVTQLQLESMHSKCYIPCSSRTVWIKFMVYPLLGYSNVPACYQSVS